jgi:predicted HTH domain antitoxin
MSLTIELPEELEAQLREKFGTRFDQEAKEALAIELYREAKLSIGQLGMLLGVGVVEAEAWLAARGVELPMTVEELTAELAGARKMLGHT